MKIFPPELSQPEARGQLERRGRADLESDDISTLKCSMLPEGSYDFDIFKMLQLCDRLRDFVSLKRDS